MGNDFLTEEDLAKELVVCFQRIAAAMEGLRDEAKRAGARYWPGPKEQKQSVVSRVPTEEDRIRERQEGADAAKPIDEWLTDLGDPEDEFIGEREREWRRTHPQEKAQVADAGPKAAGEKVGGGDKAAETKA